MPPMRSKSSGGLSGLQFEGCDIIVNTGEKDADNNKTTDKHIQVYTSSNYATNMLKHLNALRQNCRFCDVEIVAGNEVFKAHRAVLSASSPYFHAMFASGLVEMDKESIEIHYIQPNVLRLLIDFIYTGEIILGQHNVQDLIVASDMLQIKEVIHGCTEFLRNELHVSNAIGIYRFSTDHNCAELAEAARIFVENHFPIITFEEEFCELPKETLINFLDCETLKIDSEYQVFEAVLRWINYDLLSRKRFVFELFSHVRISLIPIALLECSIRSNSDSSLQIALKSVKKDLVLKKGNLVSLKSLPRLCAKKAIFVIGGSKRELIKSWTRSLEWTYDTVERYDCYSGEWVRGITPMGIGRILPGVATLNGRIFVVGGEHESQILANGEAYDPLTNSWSKVASMIVPRCEFGLCAVDGQLYALGGWVGDDIGGTIERYDPMRDEWTMEGSLPDPRFSMGVVSYNGLIYIVGGCTHAKRHLQGLTCFNPVKKTWTTLAPMLEPRSQVGVAVLDGYLYVIGGINKEPEVLKTVERYSFSQNKWTRCGMLNIGRASPAVAAANGHLYVMGGDQTHEINFYRAQVTIASVERYDPEKGEWEETTPLPDSRSEAAAIVL